MAKSTAVETTASAQPGKSLLSLGERIDRKRVLQEHLAEASDALGTARTREHSLDSEYREAHEALAGAKAAVERTHGVQPQDNFLRDKCEARVKVLRLECGKVKARIRELGAEISQIEAELHDCDRDVAPAELQELEAKIAATQRIVSEIEKAIRVEEGAIDAAARAMPMPSDMYRAREDLLSEIALGMAPRSALDELEAKIKAEEERGRKAAHSVMERARSSRHAILGLQRRLAEATKNLQHLETQRPEALLQYLRTEAGVACSQYVNLAARLRERFLQLTALEALMQAHVGEIAKPIRTASWTRLVLPAFDLPQCAVPEDGAQPGELFSAQTAQAKGAIDRAIEAERARLADLGVKLQERPRDGGTS